MSNKITLIDSSIWVECFRPEGDVACKTAVTWALRQGQAAICEIIISEILRGIRSEKDFTNIEDSFKTILCLDMKSSGIVAAKLSISLQQKGFTLPTTDLLIIATASVHKASIMHRDKHLDIAAEEMEIPVIRP